MKSELLTGEHALWGIPFQLGKEGTEPNLIVLKDQPVRLEFPEEIHKPFLVFLHGADFKSSAAQPDGIVRPAMGEQRLGETVCEYVLEYSDGTEHLQRIRRRFQINEFKPNWGENSFECVPHIQPQSFATNSEEMSMGKAPARMWGMSQRRVTIPGDGGPRHWIYPLENPHPLKGLRAVRMIPRDGTVFVFGLTFGNVRSNPVRWEARKKLRMNLSDVVLVKGQEPRLAIDLGQVISVTPAVIYDNEHWEAGYNNQIPDMSDDEIIVEYTAHPEAALHIAGSLVQRVPLESVPDNSGGTAGRIGAIKEAKQKITLQVIDRTSGKPVAVKIHIHGEAGEYLPPVNRHRLPNRCWFEDYSTDYVHRGHVCTYIDGMAEYKLPLGRIYVEISKGLEIRPVRRSIEVNAETKHIMIELEKVLPWREKGWVTADTHVHFLSPSTARLEGAAEGVNVIHLLASQWGELFSNVGDFDGKTTIGSTENGGDGEYLVRVGTENRQHIMGHISLLGYSGPMIVPLCSGGPNESAFGDPLEVTLTEWARKCREQKGIVVMPHIPNPRTEGAAATVLELIDAMEFCSYSYLYRGINPYSLSDWYRYLNCGYHVPAVAGTDKMSAETAVGIIRTYALISGKPFSFDNWMDSVRKGNTFVTYGPLLDWSVAGRSAGSRMELPNGGGTLDVQWNISSVTVPVTRIELIVNGVIQEAVAVNPEDEHYAGYWSVKVKESAWLAIRVRGHYSDQPEMIAAHSSAVFVIVNGQTLMDAADAMTILDQIEGATAFIKSLGTRAEVDVYRRLLNEMNAAHRALHHRMHSHGIFHKHTAVDDHHRHHH